MDFAWQAAEQFATEEVVAVREYGNGNINDTYIVEVGAGGDKFVLQRINVYVFNQPKLISRNLRTFTEHVERRLAQENGQQSRRWELPQVLKARSGQDYFFDDREEFWRAISYIDASQTYDTVQNDQHAWEAGYALGRFHSLLSDLNVEQMHDTLVGFHVVPQYLEIYDAVMATGTQRETTPEVEYCHEMVTDRREWAAILEEARDAGELTIRNIHGDPKINNIMISDETGQAVSMVDLDTVKPGLVHYDIGDALRSSCNPLGEDATDFEAIHFETDLAKTILDGYLSVADEFLTPKDYEYIFESIRLLAYEMGLRFFQDYLAGDVYFKVKHPEHNLHRAIVQFKLLESIEAQEDDLQAVIQNLMGRKVRG
jgi:Ser/Thr protein kinase RdoA (MazF antagonist)